MANLRKSATKEKALQMLKDGCDVSEVASLLGVCRNTALTYQRELRRRQGEAVTSQLREGRTYDEDLALIYAARKNIVRQHDRPLSDQRVGNPEPGRSALDQKNAQRKADESAPLSELFKINVKPSAYPFRAGEAL